MKRLFSKVGHIFMAIGFLTKLPIPGSIEFSSKKLSDGLLFAPIIGLLLGVILVLFYITSSIIFSSYIVAALILVFYVYITGGLHIDGLGDLGDGLFSGRRGDAFYQVMKDSRLGTGGFLTIIFVLMLDYLLLMNIVVLDDNLNLKLLLLLPVAGRLGMLFGGIIGKYPRELEGSGKLFIDGRNFKNSWWMLLIVLVMFYVLLNWYGLIIYTALLILAVVLIRSWQSRLDGITGDMCGALVEYSQLAYLFVAYILFN